MFSWVRFDHVLDNTPKPQQSHTLRDAVADLELPADALAHPIDVYRTNEDAKRSLPLFSFAVYEPGTTRHGSNVLAITALVLDIDGADEDDFVRWVQNPQCPIRSCEAYAVSTIRNGVLPGIRYRVIVALSRPVTAAEWPRFFAHIEQTWNVPNLDASSSKDLARMYIVPIDPLDGDPNYETIVPGEWPWSATLPLDVDAIMQVAPKYTRNSKHDDYEIGELKSATPDEIHEIIYPRARVVRDVGKRAMLKKVADGESFCEVGHSHEALLYITGFLVPSLNEIDTDSIIGYLKPALDAQEAVGSTINYRDLENLIHGARRKMDRIPSRAILLATQAAFGQQKNSKVTLETSPQVDPLTGDVTDEFQGDKYSASELYACAHHAGVDPLSHPDTWPWIVRNEQRFWFLSPDGYSDGMPPRAASNYRARKDGGLGRAPITIAEFVGSGKGGSWETMSLEKICDAFAVKCEYVVDDLTIAVNRWDGDREIMYQATAKRSTLQPTYHADVMTWLSKMFASDVEAGLDWLAAFPDLQFPTRCLSLTGPRSSGKTLLANGLSRVFLTGKATKLHTLLGRFNARAVRQPLCFADETIGEMTHAQFRQLLGNGLDGIERKFQEQSDVQGNLRFIIAANDLNHLATNEVSEREAQRAVADRFLHYTVPPEASVFLNSLPRSRREEFASHAIAEMTLYLAANREVDREGRFMGRAGGEDIVNDLAVFSDAPATALETVIDWIAGPQAAQVGDIRIYDGNVYVTRKFIMKKWGERDGKPPKAHILTRAMQVIGDRAPRRIFESADKKRGVYFIIDRAILTRAVERNGMMDADALADVLDDPQRYKKATIMPDPLEAMQHEPPAPVVLHDYRAGRKQP